MRLFLIRSAKFIGAVILLATVGTFAFMYAHVRYIWRHRKQPKLIVEKLGAYYYLIAFSIDQTGNVICRELFNDVLLRHAPLRKSYGNPDETVSHVTGVNEEFKTLTGIGRLLAGVLNAIDEGHTEKARNNNQFNG